MMKSWVANCPICTGLELRSTKTISALLVCGMATAPLARARRDNSFVESPVVLVADVFGCASELVSFIGCPLSFKLVSFSNGVDFSIVWTDVKRKKEKIVERCDTAIRGW